MAGVRRSSVVGLVGAIALVLWASWWGSDRGNVAHEVGGGEVTSRPDPVLVGVADETESRREVHEAVEEAPTSSPSSSAPTVDELEAARALEPGVVVRGRVVDPERRPISGAVVSSTREEEGPVEVAVSGSSGWFEGRSARIDRRTSFRVSAEGRTTAAVHLPDFGVEQTEGELGLGTIVLEPGGTVTGLVVDESGVPVEEARVKAFPPQGRPAEPLGFAFASDYPVTWTYTGSDGRFRLDGVPLGPRFLYVDLESDTMRGMSEDFEVIAGRTVEQRVVLRSTWDWLWIRGRTVTRGAPIEGVLVNGIATDSTGAFALAFADRDPVTLRVVDPRFRFSLTRLEDVLPGTEDLVVVLDPGQPLEIALRDGQGRPAAQGEITLIYGEGLRTTPIRLDDTGRVSVARPEVPFGVSAVAPGFHPIEVGPFEPEDLEPVLTITLRRGPALRGIVRFEGRPLAGAGVRLAVNPNPARGPCFEAVSVTPLDRPLALIGRAPETGGTLRTDADGTFSLPVASAGDHWVWIGAQGIGCVSFGPYRLARGAELDGLVLDVVAPGAIEGRLHMLPGESVEGRIVGASNGSGMLRTTTTDAEGRYRLEGLAPGPYQVRPCTVPLAEWQALKPGSGRCVEPIEWDCRVESGAETRFDLELRDEGSCVLVGSLGAFGSGPCVASLIRDGAPRASGTFEDGAYRLAVREPGRYHLQLLLGEVRLDSSVDLGLGETRLDLPVEHGVLRVGPVPQDVLWWLNVASVEAIAGWTARWVIPSYKAGPGTRWLLPVGRYSSVVWRDGVEPNRGEVEIRSGEETVVRVPE